MKLDDGAGLPDRGEEGRRRRGMPADLAPRAEGIYIFPSIYACNMAITSIYSLIGRVVWSRPEARLGKEGTRA